MHFLLKQLKNTIMLISVAFVIMFIFLIKTQVFTSITDFKFHSVWEIFQFTVLQMVTGDGLGKTANGGAFVFDHVILFTLRSIKIILPAFLFSMIAGIFLGLFAFQNRSNMVGKSIKSFHLLFSSLPDFFIYIIFQYGLLLAIRMGFPQLDLFGHEHWYNTLLPIISLSLYPVLYMYRITYSKLEGEAIKDYVITAKAKGKSESYIIFVHLLWNSWGTILTQSKSIMLYILASLPIIELLSFYPGMGYGLLKAVQTNDIKLSIGLILPFLIMMWIILLISDIAAHLLIPIELGQRKGIRPQRIGLEKRIFVSIMTYFWNGWLFIRSYPLFLFSSFLVLILLFTAFIGPNLPFVDKDLKEVMYIRDQGKIIIPPLPPSGDYWFGTDRSGKDLLSLLVIGAKGTLFIVGLITLVRFIFAIPLGYLAARRIAPFSLLLKIFQMVFSYFPIFFIILVMMTVSFFLESETRPYWMIFFLAIVEIGRLGNIYKEEFERIGEQEYVLAGMSTGTKGIKLFANYFFPPMRKLTIIFFTTELGGTLFLLAQLGFVSVFLSHEFTQNELGEWGYHNTFNYWPVLLANATYDIRGPIWILFYTSSCIAFTIISFTLLGEGFKSLFSKKRFKVEKHYIEEKVDNFLNRIKLPTFSSKKVLLSSAIVVLLLSVTGFYLVQKHDKKSTVGQVSENNQQVIENLTAFAKVYGYVRYFHPSSEAVYLDWDKYALYGINQVKNAENENELKQKLTELYYPIAPAMKFYNQNDDITEPYKDADKSSPTLKVVGWQHQGLGPELDMFTIMKEASETPSEGFTKILYRKPFNQTEQTPLLFDQLPKEDEYIKEFISKNISIVMPLTAYLDKDKGEIGSTTESENQYLTLREKLKTIDLTKTLAESKEMRVADTILAWNQIQHFYPNLPETERAQWEMQLRVGLEGALKAKTEKEYLASLRKMLSPLNDSQADISIAEIGNKEVQLPFLVDFVDEKIVVSAVDHSSELQMGDVILEKDGKNAVNLIKKQSESFIGSKQWNLKKALEAFTKGKIDEKSTFKIQRNGKEKEITLTYTKSFELDENGSKEVVKEVKSGVYYVNLIQTDMEDITPHLGTLAQAKGIIFDLRGKPKLSTKEILAHLISKPASGAQYNIPQIIYPDYKNVVGFNTLANSEWSFEPAEPRIQRKIIFLTDANSIGDAESYLQFVTENQIGELVGSNTAGANGKVYSTQLPGNLKFSWTGMKVTRQDGTTTHGVGISPAVNVTRTLEGILTGKDEYIEKAVEAIEEN